MTDSGRWFSVFIFLILAGFVYAVGPVLIPFLIAFLLAYLLNPLVTRLRRWKIPRAISATLIFVVVLALILALLLWLIPLLGNQIALFIQKLPQMITWIEHALLPWVNHVLHTNIQLDLNHIKQALLNRMSGHGSDIATTLARTIFSSGFLVVGIAVNIILIPIVTVYFLSDWAKITAEGQRFIFLSTQKRQTLVRLIRECGDVLAAFFRGQFMVMLGLAVVYSVGLSIVGVDLAILIGIGAGLLSIVPYLGFTIGIVVSLIATAIQFPGWIHIVAVLGVFAIGQVCESFIFSPLFVGDRIGLHPIAVIFAVLAGGKLFGFVGVLLALPVTAVIMVFIRYLRDNANQGGG